MAAVVGVSMMSGASTMSLSCPRSRYMMINAGSGRVSRACVSWRWELSRVELTMMPFGEVDLATCGAVKGLRSRCGISFGVAGTCIVLVLFFSESIAGITIVIVIVIVGLVSVSNRGFLYTLRVSMNPAKDPKAGTPRSDAAIKSGRGCRVKKESTTSGVAGLLRLG
jgi:hypothetical protein